MWTAIVIYYAMECENMTLFGNFTTERI